MLIAVTTHLVMAILAPALTRRMGPRVFWVLALAPALTAAWVAARLPQALSGAPITEVLPWVPSLRLELAFRLDPLSWLLALIASGIGTFVLVYCSGYFDDDEPGLGRFAACLVAFAGVMLGLVTADDALLLFVFWEATTILSYLLIGHRAESRSSRSAAMEALVVTTFGGLAMLVGVVMLGEQAGTYRISQIVAHGGSGPYTEVAVVLLLLGALSKSALLPFHFWLPGAMAAPTPVSAYLHAAAMVKAGVYLVARLAPAFADLASWFPIVVVLGGGTMIVGAAVALRQTDLKLLLAYGTVSQLGFLVVLTGTGTSTAALAGVTVLAAHALFKSCLFLVVGAIDHATGTRDLRRLTGLARRMPVLCGAAVVAAASMAGLPPMLGFVGKETAYTAYTDRLDHRVSLVVLAVLILGSILTLMYSVRFVWGAFGNRRVVTEPDVHDLGPTLSGVPALLAALTVAAGVGAPLVEAPLQAYAAGVGPEPTHVHLELWHGLTLALGLTLLTWAAGFAGAAWWHRHGVHYEVRRTQDPGQRVYRRLMRTLDRVSLETTGAIQRGSLPLSLGLILATYLGLGVTTLLTSGFAWTQVRWVWADGIGQVVTAVLVAVMVGAAVRARRRLRAVILVGATGYGCAFLFLLHGAPDLALTQVLVETLSIIVFVLVLRRLPARFDEDPTHATARIRRAVGVAVGVFTAALAFAVPTLRTAAPASVGMSQEAYAFGFGKNVVNVILVDIRAWDTMGELSVVLAAATGVASLVFLRESNVEGARRRMGEVLARRAGITRVDVRGRWLAEGGRLLVERRPVILEVVTRLIFHAVLLWSIYLLFAGHNAPGGGFAAGLVAGLGLALRYLAGGRDELRAAMPVPSVLLLGTGLFLSAGNALVSVLLGGEALQTWDADLHIPYLGELHLVTSLVFDIGVYLVVIGLVLDILQSLGSALDVQIEAEPGRAGADAPVHSDDPEGLARAEDPVGEEHRRLHDTAPGGHA